MKIVQANNKKGRTNNRNSDRNHNSTNSNGTVKEDRNCKVVTIHQNEKSALAEHEEKMQQFEEIMGRIVGKALREQAENLGDAMGNHLCNKMLREVDRANGRTGTAGRRTLQKTR